MERYSTILYLSFIWIGKYQHTNPNNTSVGRLLVKLMDWLVKGKEVRLNQNVKESNRVIIVSLIVHYDFRSISAKVFKRLRGSLQCRV